MPYGSPLVALRLYLREAAELLEINDQSAYHCLYDKWQKAYLADIENMRN